MASTRNLYLAVGLMTVTHVCIIVTFIFRCIIKILQNLYETLLWLISFKHGDGAEI